MIIALTSETSPCIQHGEILIVSNILSSSGIRNHPKDKYRRYLADLETARAMLSEDLGEEWQYESSISTKILLLFNGSSKEYVGNPEDISQLKSQLFQ